MLEPGPPVTLQRYCDAHDDEDDDGVVAGYDELQVQPCFDSASSYTIAPIQRKLHLTYEYV